MNIKEIWNRLFRMRSGLAIVIVAALLIQLTGAVQYYFSYKAISKEVRTLAQKELQLIDANVSGRLDEVEMAAHCMAVHIEDNLEIPDSVYHTLKQLVEKCPTIVNSAVAFTPHYYPNRGRWFEPLAMRNEDGTIDTIQAGGSHHDYHNLEFYTTALACDSNYWSEPYMNETGRQLMVASYALPLHDARGKQVGVLCTDVPLDWLNELANKQKIHPSSYIMILSREGGLIVYPKELKQNNKRIEDIKDGRHKSVDEMNRRMMAGESGEMEVFTPKGEERLVFFSPVGNDVGWSMAVVCNKDELYKDLKNVQFYVFLLMLAGIALLSLIIWRTVRAQMRMKAIDTANERMGSELRIASNIQQGMLPKKFPPFPERNDIDIFASLKPAKEVGGDLYDYFIRDEKLFFCIGDVSGKGVPASLVMAVARSLFHSITEHETRPASIADQMNKAGTHNNEQLMFVTYFIGILDLPTGRLRYCNAGHDAPILLTKDNVEPLPVISNLPLGIDGSFQYVSQETTISPDTTIFLYTDGLTEAMDPNHALFTPQRMMTALHKANKHELANPKSLVEHMSDAVSDFVNGAEPSDDLAMMAIRYSEPSHKQLFEDSITLSSDIKEIPKLTEWIAKVTEKTDLPASDVQQVRLAIEEAVVNIMEYAFPANNKGEINLTANVFTDQLRLRITDDGTAFDPTTHNNADVTLSAEERPIGGLGIYLVRQYMDAINYERDQNKNVLTLFKKI